MLATPHKRREEIKDRGRREMLAKHLWLGTTDSGVSLPLDGNPIAFDMETGEVKLVDEADLDLLLHGSPEQSLSQFLRIFDQSGEVLSERPF